MKKTIITISREFGSGGREIGKKLAEQLNVPFYDKELIEIAAKESGLDKELFEEEDSRTSKGFRLLGALGYSLGGPLSTITELSLNDRLFLVQSQVIEVDERDIENSIHKIDKRRANYYEYYTDRKWGRAENYDISLNSSTFGIDGCVEIIKEVAVNKSL